MEWGQRAWRKKAGQKTSRQCFRNAILLYVSKYVRVEGESLKNAAYRQCAQGFITCSTLVQ